MSIYLKLAMVASLFMSGFSSGWFVADNIADKHIAELHKSYSDALHVKDESIDLANYEAQRSKIVLQQKYSKGIKEMLIQTKRLAKEHGVRIQQLKKVKIEDEDFKVWSNTAHPSAVTDWLHDLSKAR